MGQEQDGHILLRRAWVAATGVAAIVCMLPAAATAAPAIHADTVAVAPGEELYVESTGSGDPVVIVPGLFGSAFGFRKIIAPIARLGHQVILVEPLGVGESARPRNADYSLEAQARRVGAVLDSFHVAGAIVVAHSVGSSVALRLALARPSLVRGIVSIEGGIAEAAGTPGLRRALSLASILGHFGLRKLVMGKLRGSFRASSGDPSWVTDEVMAAYLAPVRADFQGAIAAYRAMASAAEPLPLAPRLSRVHIPVELLLGSAPHDNGVNSEELSVMRARLPRLTIVRVPGAGIWIQEERPQAVVDAVRRMGTECAGRARAGVAGAGRARLRRRAGRRRPMARRPPRS